MILTQSYRIIICYVFAFFFCLDLTAQHVTVSSDVEVYNIRHDSYLVLKDTSKSLTFEQISSPSFQERFTSNQEQIHSADAVYWLKISLKGDALRDNNWFLESRDPSVNEIDFYLLDSNGSYQRHEMGNLRNFDNKIFHHKNFIVGLPNNHNETTVYVRIYSEKPVFFSFMLKSTSALTSYSYREYLLLGMFYGLMMIMALYNLIVFFFVQKRIYIWYVLYVISCMIICLSEDGLGFQFLWPETPFINNYVEWISGIAFLVFFTLYSNSYLRLRERQPKFLKLIIAVNTLSIFSVLFQDSFQYDISYSILYNTPIILIFIAGIIEAYKGDKFAKAFVVALSFVVSSILLLYLKRMGLVNWEILSTPMVIILVYAFNFALVFEVLILSIALGHYLQYSRDQKDQAIQASQGRFKSIFESSFNAILVYDCKNKKMLDINNQATELFNYSKSEFLKIRPIDIIKDIQDTEDAILETLQNSCDSKTNLFFESVGFKKGKIGFDCEISITKLNEENDGSFVLSIKDISRQKLAERGLEDRLKEINENNIKLKKYIESNLELTNFAYVASHDMRQPVRTIKSFSQLLKRHLTRNGTLDSVGQEYLDFIISGSNNLEDLINDLLDHSKVSSSNDTKIIESNLEDVLLRVQLNLNKQINETQTKIKTINLPALDIEPVRMLQLFQNIISNAIKFRSKIETCKIIIEGKEFEDVWQISVADNGIGIPDNKKEKVFDLFEKLHGMSEYSGHGIGLATCKKIVEFHEGEIWLESELGIGTTFYFTIKKGLKTPNLTLETTFEER